MKWIRQTTTAAANCRHCNTPIRVGQVALEQRLPNNPINDRVFRVHAKCIRTLLASCPLDQDEISFNELRDQILATGEMFPKESCAN